MLIIFNRRERAYRTNPKTAQRYSFFLNYARKKNKKNAPQRFCSRKLLRIGFEACFSLCNPATSSALCLLAGHGWRVPARHWSNIDTRLD